MLALPSLTEAESWVVSVKGGNSLHPAEPGLAFTMPAFSDNETEGEMHHSETTRPRGSQPGAAAVAAAQQKCHAGPGAVSDSGARGGKCGRGE